MFVATEIDQGVVGLPIRSSDDQQIGLVMEAGIDDGEAILIGEIERPLGIGADVVVITGENVREPGRSYRADASR